MTLNNLLPVLQGEQKKRGMRTKSKTCCNLAHKQLRRWLQAAEQSEQLGNVSKLGLQQRLPGARLPRMASLKTWKHRGLPVLNLNLGRFTEARRVAGQRTARNPICPDLCMPNSQLPQLVPVVNACMISEPRRTGEAHGSRTRVVPIYSRPPDSCACVRSCGNLEGHAPTACILSRARACFSWNT